MHRMARNKVLEGASKKKDQQSEGWDFEDDVTLINIII
jgi:hypothetical protein